MKQRALARKAEIFDLTTFNVIGVPDVEMEIESEGSFQADFEPEPLETVGKETKKSSLCKNKSQPKKPFHRNNPTSTEKLSRDDVMQRLIDRVEVLGGTLDSQGVLIRELTRENQKILQQNYERIEEVTAVHHKRMERLQRCTLDYIKSLEIPRYFEAVGLSKKSSGVDNQIKESRSVDCEGDDGEKKHVDNCGDDLMQAKKGSPLLHCPQDAEGMGDEDSGMSFNDEDEPLSSPAKTNQKDGMEPLQDTSSGNKHAILENWLQVTGETMMAVETMHPPSGLKNVHSGSRKRIDTYLSKNKPKPKAAQTSRTVASLSRKPFAKDDKKMLKVKQLGDQEGKQHPQQNQAQERKMSMGNTMQEQQR